MNDFGITAYGAYIPTLRLERAAIAAAHKWVAPSLRGLAKGNRAFCNWDEDTITMAVAAARDALARDEMPLLDTIGFASTRSPYADLQPSAIIAGALGLPSHLRAVDSGYTQRAGTSGLLGMIKTGEPGLFLASDAPIGKPASPQEISFGSGAAAFVLGHENVAAKLLGYGSVTANFVDHFRAADEKYDYHWEERWIRDEGYAKLVPQAVEAALERAGLGMGDVTTLAMASMQRGITQQVAKRLKFEGALTNDLSDGCGYAGTAQAPLMLAKALEDAASGERIMVIAFGQGVDVLIFEATDAIAKARPPSGVSGALAGGIVTDAYLRMLSFTGGIEIERGMRAEKSGKAALTEQYRTRDQIEAFIAGKCETCETVQFPQLQYCVNCHAPGAQFSPVSLCDEPAKVMTSTADWLSYYPSPPLYVGFIQFDNGARVQMELVDVGPEGIEIGTRLDMVFRIKERDAQRGYNRYFWKAVPQSATGEA